MSRYNTNNNNTLAISLDDLDMSEMMAYLDADEDMDDYDRFLRGRSDGQSTDYDSDGSLTKDYTFASEADRLAVLAAMHGSTLSDVPQPSRRGRGSAQMPAGPAAVVMNARLAFKPDGKIQYPTTAENIAQAHMLAGKPTYADMSQCLVVFLNLAQAQGIVTTRGNTITMYGLLYAEFANRSRTPEVFMSGLAKPNNIARTQEAFIARHCMPALAHKN